MLAPHELKNAEFTKSLRGYSTVEVDEHIDFLIEKYTELYRLNDELEKKLRITEAQLDALKAEEESIKITLVNAQKASTRIINEANERADVIMRSAKNSCDKLLLDFGEKIEDENARLIAAKKQTEAFKISLLKAYREHILGLEKISPDLKIEENSVEIAEELKRRVLVQISADLDGEQELISGSFDPFTPVDESSDTVSEGGDNAEKVIPDSIDDTDKEESSSITDARDKDTDLLTERTLIVENGSSIIDSIRKISENAKDVSDDALLSILDNASARNSVSNSNDEFDVVYDGKRKK